jgi:hypothetical protein
VLEKDGGDDHTTMQIYRKTVLKCTLTEVKMVYFILCIFHHNF